MLTNPVMGEAVSIGLGLGCARACCLRGGCTGQGVLFTEVTDPSQHPRWAPLLIHQHPSSTNCSCESW